MIGCGEPTSRTLREPKTLAMIGDSCSSPLSTHPMLTGAPISDGQDYDSGVDKAPQALRDGGLEAVSCYAISSL